MSSMIYPHADHTSQWFAGAHPGATMNLAAGMALVLHTTEGVGWWGYNGGSEAPTFTLWPGHGVRQHFPVNMSARALVHKAGTTATNTQNCVQIELVGTCDPNSPLRGKTIFWPEATDAQLSELAHLVLWLHKEWGLKLNAAPKWLPYDASAGHSSARFSSAQWLAFEGVCGHQHVVGNDHGDPGNFPIERLFALVRKLAGEHDAPATSAHANTAVARTATPASTASPVHPFSHAVLLAGVKTSGTGRASGNCAIVQHALSIVYPDAHLVVDGHWGPKTSALYARWQRDNGATGANANGTPGRGTLAALFARADVIKVLAIHYTVVA